MSETIWGMRGQKNNGVGQGQKSTLPLPLRFWSNSILGDARRAEVSRQPVKRSNPVLPNAAQSNPIVTTRFPHVIIANRKFQHRPLGRLCGPRPDSGSCFANRRRDGSGEAELGIKTRRPARPIEHATDPLNMSGEYSDVAGWPTSSHNDLPVHGYGTDARTFLLNLALKENGKLFLAFLASRLQYLHSAGDATPH